MAEGVLVVGSGVAGMKAALEVASRGRKVWMLERGPFLGGELMLLERQFPTDRCGLCQMLPTYARSREGEYCLRRTFYHPEVEVLLLGELLGLEGRKDGFRALIRRRPRGVREDLCVSCGRCIDVCPVEVPDEFNPFSLRKAIYLRGPDPSPPVPAVDWEACNRCGRCLQICPTGAIDLESEGKEEELEVSSVILASGFEPFDPRPLTQYGYGRFQNVLTTLEFERMLSPLGPGRPFRPSDGQPPKKIAFLLCVGSRERRWDYCSSACCMIALKQARLALEVSEDLEVAVFYMDLRAFGKGYHRYLLETRRRGVQFIRGRVPKLWEDPRSKRIILNYLSDGSLRQGEFDLVVLSTGQRPPQGNRRLADLLGVELDRWGFVRTVDPAGVRTTRPGVYVCGPLSGPKDIPDTVTQALAAAFEASKGAVPSPHEARELPSQEEPRVGLLICRCGGEVEFGDIRGRLEGEGFSGIWEAEYLCLGKGVPEFEGVDRLVVGACTPYWFRRRGLEVLKGFHPEMVEWVDLRGALKGGVLRAVEELLMALERSRRQVLSAPEPLPVAPSALVVGGGLAGMEAALALAREGVEVHLVEREEELGGRLRRERPDLLGEYLQRVREEPRIAVHLRTRVKALEGTAGAFLVSLRESSGEGRSLQVGAVILATGARALRPEGLFGYGEDPRVITQGELSAGFARGEVAPRRWRSVAMIQCVGSRDREHPWCSRYCCLEALENALKLKERNPTLEVYIFYRDMMSYGLKEELFTKARERGVVFLRYDEIGRIRVEPSERILLQWGGLELEVDLLVLSTGDIPGEENQELAELFGLELTPEGFFKEAEVKFRPVDAVREGIYLCGGCHSPRPWGEVVLQARAAAQRALGLLKRTELRASWPISTVNERRCSGCGLCVQGCPYGARVLDEELRVARVKGPLCQGCGVCASLCPNGAAKLEGTREDQVIAALERVL